MEGRTGRSRSLSNIDEKEAKCRCPTPPSEFSKRRRIHSGSSASAKSNNSDSSWTNRSKELKNVSNWKRTDLENFGIYYNDKNLSLKEFFSLLEENSETEFKDIPAVTHLMIQLTDEHFQLSLENCGIYMKRKSTNQDIKTVEESCKELKSSISGKTESDNEGASKILTIWSYKLQEFHSDDLLKFLEKLQDEKQLNEIDFQILFMKFTEIFIMKPELGDACQRTVTINGEAVECFADIRYLKRSSEGLVLVLVTEMKKDQKKLNENEEDCVTKLLSDDILGQVGVELLIESQHSYFCPGVLGILCCATKMIFLYCEITPQHFDAIINKDKHVEDHSTIHFTKPYDYMNVDDRKEIVQYLFWLGYIQSSDYQIMRNLTF